MFGDMEGVVRSALTEKNIEDGVEEVFIEERGYDWVVTYYIYADKVQAVEYMDDNPEHCTAEAKTLSEVMAITSQWC